MSAPTRTSAASPSAHAPHRPGVEAAGLVHAFGPVRALDHVGFAAPAGRLSALTGPPGCGKTTLLQVLAGLLAPAAGRASVAGVDVVRQPDDARRRVGLVPAVVGTWDALTPAEVLRTLGAAHRLDAGAARRRADDVLDLVGLTSVADRRVAGLSGDARRRLGLAQALVHSPDVLLVDEHAERLDASGELGVLVDEEAGAGGVRELHPLLRCLVDGGLTVLAAGRDPGALPADLVLRMEAGRVVASHDLAHEAGVRWRVAVLDVARARSVLARHGTGYADVAGPGSGSTRGSLDVDVADERDAAALLSLLVAEDVAVFGFAPVAAFPATRGSGLDRPADAHPIRWGTT